MVSERDQIQEFIDSVTRAKDQLRIDVPGWVLRRPAVAEIEDQIAFVIAESKEGEHLPFMLPGSASCSLCVTKGSALLTEHGANTQLTAPRFHVLGAGEHRQLTPLEHPTTVVCLFFRAEGLTGGFAVDSR
jgi:hypothetical protein